MTTTRSIRVIHRVVHTALLLSAALLEACACAHDPVIDGGTDGGTDARSSADAASSDADIDGTIAPDSGTDAGAADAGGTEIPPPRAVSSSVLHELLIRQDGTVWARGRYDFGQLGDGTLPAPGPDPSLTRSMAAIVPGLSNITAIATRAEDSYAVDADGVLWAFGAGSYSGFGPETGYLGDGTTTTSPVPVRAMITEVVEIATAEARIYARRRDGSVWEWGYETSGLLPPSLRTPTPVPGLSAIANISFSGFHVLAVAESGTLYAWGRNATGELGRGTTGFLYQGFPVAPVPGVSGVVGSCARQGASYAVTETGELYAWGDNAGNFLGVDTAPETFVAVPTRVTGIPTVAEIFCGEVHVLARTDLGEVWVWGYGAQLGLGDAGATANRPTRVPGLSGVTRVFAQSRMSWAWIGEGVAYAWGANAIGELGVGPPSPTVPTPTLVTNAFE